jgi:hypothetical protein
MTTIDDPVTLSIAANEPLLISLTHPFTVWPPNSGRAGVLYLSGACPGARG